MPAASLTTTTSSNVKSGCDAIRLKNHFAYFSNRDTPPPLDLAAALPVSPQSRTQLMTELGLTSKSSATSRREAPDLSASIASLSQVIGIGPRLVQCYQPPSCH